MQKLPVFPPISLKLYPKEAVLLRDFVFRLGENARDSGAYAPVAHYVLYEWLVTKFWMQSVRMELSNPKKARNITIPVGIAILLHRQMNGAYIELLLQNVLSGLDQALKNRNLIQEK